MMLPGAAPAVFKYAHTSGRVRAVPLLVGSYLGVWTLVGVAVYALYRPHASFVAGAVAIAAGVYELTPVKRSFRRRCHENIRSGLGFGVDCVGSRRRMSRVSADERAWLQNVVGALAADRAELRGPSTRTGRGREP
jgi:predicted metal-binding membrane protein